MYESDDVIIIDINLFDLSRFAKDIMNISFKELKYYALRSNYVLSTYRVFVYPNVQYKAMDFMFKKILNCYLWKVEKKTMYKYTRILITNYSADVKYNIFD